MQRPVREVLAEAEATWRTEGPAEPVDDGRASVTSIHAREQWAHPSGHDPGVHLHDHDHDHDHESDHDHGPGPSRPELVVDPDEVPPA
jgi:hypothetical protein